ncbi:NAD-dependent succinate-semialdehyde dehydrogenase [Janthinobacterium agaricidamnosum]|uniref:Succinate-semialdehyde dehydrogenase n=1 Tax=Janthinobacterium agaricidamnosum NBRC 102515 = DSM 9628 TaxID=1349767 RepID=W0VEK6_9BURK|nr:NAD-dependent succinate-semialdehyde dehydrogenase [Janthinobacterium agaricidamnosum]CDG85843.1 succinate-semialdehyde dehydrogenase [Janthinobacterium agaricidamnosum NBRC 102515 = DSM 9628]
MLQLKDASLLRQQAYLNGAWVDADSGQTFDVSNPASGDIIGSVPLMGAAETRRAIEAANAAWPAWRKKTAKERGAVLRRWYELIVENSDDLALIMTTEQGKPLAEAKGEIQFGSAFIEWFAEEAKRIAGDTLQSPWPDRRIVVAKEPIGVCAAITPWNFPSAMITRKVGPALAAGCPMVLKPAEATPFSALALAVLAERAGVPAGVFSIVTGAPKDIGAEMTGNPIVRKLSFTGSTQVGRLLMQQSAPTVKKLSLELGGNAAFIVFDDADLDAAIEGVMASKYRNVGQTCICANRIYVQDGVYQAFAEKLVAAVATLKVGNGAEAGTTQGPLIDDKAVQKVESYVADALAKGGRLLAGGKRHALGHSFFEPTVIADMTHDMRVATEEIFGPLAALFRFQTDEEVVALANDTEFGLASYFYSRDIGRIWRVAEGLETGMVGVNTGLISNEIAPFGGVKQSGLGREGSKYGIDDYLVIKYICMGGI